VRKSILSLVVWVSFLMGMVVWGNTLQLTIMNGGPAVPKTWTLPGFITELSTAPVWAVYGDHPYMVVNTQTLSAEKVPFTAYRIRDGPHIFTPS
jgi:hypothetical protein